MNEIDDPRVRMAAERTLLASVRTGLAVLAFGLVILDPGPGVVQRSTRLAVWFAAVLAAIGFLLVGSLPVRSVTDRSVAALAVGHAVSEEVG